MTRRLIYVGKEEQISGFGVASTVASRPAGLSPKEFDLCTLWAGRVIVTELLISLLINY